MISYLIGIFHDICYLPLIKAPITQMTFEWPNKDEMKRFNNDVKMMLISGFKFNP